MLIMIATYIYHFFILIISTILILILPLPTQLQQKQIRAALKMELPLTRKDCAIAVTHHNKRRQLNAAVLGSNIASLKHDQSFAAFQSNCASNYDTDLYFTAEGIGTSDATDMSVSQLKCLLSACLSNVHCWCIGY